MGTETISASVGMYDNGTRSCHNFPVDVDKVVQLLNGITAGQGGCQGTPLAASPSAAILSQAIRRFQQTQTNSGTLPRLSVDGHVDPSGNTLRRLNELSAARSALSLQSIGYDVPLIPQTTAMGCWAAGIAMICAWRDHLSIDPTTIARNPGDVPYLAQLQTGLNPNDASILRRWGFATEAPQSYTVAGFVQLLRRFGPLWVAAAVPGPHIRVVTGFSPDPAQAGGGLVGINDPWERGMPVFRWPNRGARYTLSYFEFNRQVGALGTRERAEAAPVYVAHLR